MTTYRQILAEALAHEDKTHRDQVLARYPEQGPIVCRAMMRGMARRLAAWIRAGTERDRRTMSSDRVRARYYERINAIDPAWLRRRVELIMWDQSNTEKQRLRELREAIQ